MSAEESKQPNTYVGAIHPRLQRRADVIAHLRRQKKFDLVISGSSLSSLSLARLAAFNGFSTLLISAKDFVPPCYGEIPVSVLPWLAKNKSLAQLFRLSNAMSKDASHLFSHDDFEIISDKGVLNRINFYLHRCLRTGEFSVGKTNMPDGTVRLARLLAEESIAAQQEGAIALNYIAKTKCYENASGTTAIALEDELTQSSATIYAKVIVSEFSPKREGRSLWVTAEFPFKQKVRPSVVAVDGTVAIVRTTGDQAIIAFTYQDNKNLDAIKNRKVIEVVNKICNAARIRIADQELIKIRWPRDSFGALSSSAADMLLPSSYSIDASVVAYRGLKQLNGRLQMTSRPLSLGGRPYPGAARMSAIADFRKAALDAQVNIDLVEKAIKRFGARVRYFQDIPGGFEPLCNHVLKGEIELIADCENVTSVDDILFRLDDPALFDNSELRAALNAQWAIATPNPV